MTPVPQPGPRLSTFDRRRNWPVLAFASMFASCLLFAYLWFNTDEIRSQKPEVRYQIRPPSSEQTGYTFVEEPVSDEVKKIFGTTDILNGTFYKIGDRSIGDWS